MYRWQLFRIVPIALTVTISIVFGNLGSTPFSPPQVFAQTSYSRKVEADQLLQQGIEQNRSGKFEAALQSWQQALKIYRELRDRRGEANTLGNLGLAYAVIENYQTAIDYFQQSLAISRQIPDRQSEANSLGNIGLAYVSLEDYQTAIDYFQQSLAISRQIPDRQSETFTLGNIGLAYISLEDYPTAIDYFQQTLTLSRQISDRQSEAFTLENLGLAYSSLGDYSQGIDYYQQALTFARKFQNINQEIGMLAALGFAFAFVGEHQTALDYQNQILLIARKLEERQLEGKVLGDMGMTYFSLADYDKAKDYHQHSLAIAQEFYDYEAATAALNNLGLDSMAELDYAKAIDYYQQALALAQEFLTPSEVAVALGNLGLAYSFQEDDSKAIDYYHQSLAIAQEVKNPELEGVLINNLGRSLWRSGKFIEAEKALRDGIELWESIRGDLGSNSAYKVSIFERQAGTYTLLQQVLVAQNKTNQALEIAEQGRARALVELLGRRLSSQPAQLPQINSPNLQQIQQIAQDQNATIVEYSMIPDAAAIEGRLKSQTLEILIWVVQPNGKVTFRRSDLKPLLQQQNTSLEVLVPTTLESLRRSSCDGLDLQDGDLVRMKDDPPEWQAWKVVTIDRQNCTIQVRFANDEENAPLATRPLTDVGEIVSSSRGKRLNLQQLYQLLIQPIAELLPTEPNARVIFIPHRELFAVPFAALQDPQGKYLIEKHTILTAPSIQTLELTRQQKQRLGTDNFASLQGQDVLVVGNPTMPSVRFNPGETPQPLPPLPATELEAKAIARLFNTDFLTEDRANKIAVKERILRSKVIHLATHGLLYDFTGGTVPGAIALAPSANDNGFLTAEEILNLNLNAELVVLSACNTGKGRITGDGVIGLSRSLISAGVPSVIVSLWQVPDAATAELMTAFYQNLKQNPDKAQALRQAMLKTMQEHPEPNDWAAFTLIGEAE